MEPRLKSRLPWIIPDALQAPRFGRTTFRDFKAPEGHVWKITTFPPVTPCFIDRARAGRFPAALIAG